MSRFLKRVAKGVGYLWATPTVIVAFVFLIGPAWVSRQIVSCGWLDGAWEFVLVKDSWLNRKYGFKFDAICFGWTITYSNHAGTFDSRYCQMHERAHIAQQWVIGPLYLPFWFLFHFVFGYRRNPFEVHAKEWGYDYVRYMSPLFERPSEPGALPSAQSTVTALTVIPSIQYPQTTYVPAAKNDGAVEEIGQICEKCDYPVESHNESYIKDGEEILAGTWVWVEGIGKVDHEQAIAWKEEDEEEMDRAIAQMADGS